MLPILVLTASLELIKWHTKYVHLRRVNNAYLLDIFDIGPDTIRPTQDGKFCDPTRPDSTRPMNDPTGCNLCTDV